MKKQPARNSSKSKKQSIEVDRASFAQCGTTIRGDEGIVEALQRERIRAEKKHNKGNAQEFFTLDGRRYTIPDPNEKPPAECSRKDFKPRSFQELEALWEKAEAVPKSQAALYAAARKKLEEACSPDTPTIRKRGDEFITTVRVLKMKAFAPLLASLDNKGFPEDRSIGSVLCRFWSTHDVKTQTDDTPVEYLRFQNDALISNAVANADKHVPAVLNAVDDALLAERIVLTQYGRIDRDMGAWLYLIEARKKYIKHGMQGTISFVDYVYHKYPIEIRAMTKQELEEAGLEASEEQMPSGEKREETRQAASAAADGAPAQEKATTPSASIPRRGRPKGTDSRWTEELDKEVLRLHRDGLPWKEIPDLLNQFARDKGMKYASFSENATKSHKIPREAPRQTITGAFRVGHKCHKIPSLIAVPALSGTAFLIIDISAT